MGVQDDEISPLPLQVISSRQTGLAATDDNCIYKPVRQHLPPR
jgi:hypothetical protein